MTPLSEARRHRSTLLAGLAYIARESWWPDDASVTDGVRDHVGKMRDATDGLYAILSRPAPVLSPEVREAAERVKAVILRGAETGERESRLAALIVELARIEAGQAEAKKVMKEVKTDLEEQIQRLAAEIESGQGVLGLEVPND